MRRGSRTPPAAPAPVGAGEGPGGRRYCLPNTCEVPPASPPAPISPALPLPSQPRQRERRFSRWLPWVTSAPQIFPSKIATLIENRGSALSLRGLLRQACGPHWQGTNQNSLASELQRHWQGSRAPKTSSQPGWPHSIPSRMMCWGPGLLAHNMTWPNGEDHHSAKPGE